ncbi:type II secretion system F family protein [Candidatus Nitrosotenuis sp. DW1]|uniref:type II secretion system F family protein n=1 Tax=Candidatus Nitrosotenuis sp. DW1 TaxID=2259672 RepID=UPI002101DB14|nr:type II secretion system F family protein [Candidatus Nitrosotenuis sp. DW1]
MIGVLKSREIDGKKRQPSSFQVFSYRLLNRYLHFLYPRLPRLRENIRQSMMPVPFEVFVANMVLSSIIAAIVGLVATISASIVFNLTPVATIILILVGSIGCSGGTFAIMQVIPAINVKTRAAKLSEEIPHYIGYMATLCASGLSLEGIFKSIAKENAAEEVVRDAKFVTRNIEILGMDVVTAISDLIKRTPNGPYSELLEGAIITFRSGGNLREYFLATAKVHLEEKKISVKRSTESLGIMAELYTILLIVFPLMAVIMLSIMAIMNPNLGGFDLITLMNMLTYILVPLFGIVLLLMMNSMVPKR